jgi:3-phytase
LTKLRLSAAAGAMALLLAAGSCARRGHDSTMVHPSLATEAVTDDPDDPAVWVNPGDPAASLILGTNKAAAPSGALVVFGLDGKTRQTVAGLDRPNNVDVEYGLALGGQRVDIAVATERLKNRLRVFRISAGAQPLTDVTSEGGTRVFASETGERAEPMGVSLYKRPSDGAIFAIVAPKTGAQEGYLGQYLLEDDGRGRVKATEVRRFGKFQGGKEIEAVAVDDALGYVYYADEGFGIHKWAADPNHPEAGKELAVFGRAGWQGDHEGIGIEVRPDGKGFLVCTDQIAGDTHYHFFRREGGPGGPHDHAEMVRCVRGGADSTDGIEVAAVPLGERFPQGLMAVMNSGPKNFLLFRWDEAAGTGR